MKQEDDAMAIPAQIRITEVSTRDGIQNLAKFIETPVKVDLIKRIIDAGADEVEFSAFVHPKWVPQMADVVDVFAGIKDYAQDKGVNLIALVPNKKGAERAKAIGVQSVNLVLSASEIHNQKNVNKTIAESMADLKETMQELGDLDVRLALACTFGSPFGDEVPADRVLDLIDQANAMGIQSIGLADSAGLSTPLNTRCLLEKIARQFDLGSMSIHLHDTRGMGIANAFVALEAGITRFDSSLGALGGCPFIPGAKGNIASEDLVNMVNGMGLKTQYDLKQMMPIVYDIETLLEQKMTSSLASCMRQS